MSFACEILPGNFSLGKPEFSFFFFFFIISFLDLSCSTWDLHCEHSGLVAPQHVGS